MNEIVGNYHSKVWGKKKKHCLISVYDGKLFHHLTVLTPSDIFTHVCATCENMCVCVGGGGISLDKISFVYIWK